MKKLSIITLLTLSVTLLNAQKKDTTKTTVFYDTVETGYKVILVLDSSSYSGLVNLISSIPAGQNKMAGYYLNLIDGSSKNIAKQPVYGLKPKKK